MLNELYGLAHKLTDMNIEVKQWHREYRPLPKTTYRVWLTSGGAVHDIDLLSADHVRTLRRFGNNQNSFPAFNIAPLYRVTGEEEVAELDGMIKDPSRMELTKVRSWCTQDNWRESRVQQIERCLHKSSLNLLRILEKHPQCGTASLVALIRLACGFRRNGKDSFRAALEDGLFANLQKEVKSSLMLTLLFHKGNPQKDMDSDTGSRSIILDLQEWRKYGSSVADEATTHSINEALLEEDAFSDAKDHPGPEGGLGREAILKLDAFGVPFHGVGEPMPNVKLPGFDVTLRTMFHAQECQYRYGTIEDASFPMARQNRALAKGALEWMAQTEQENVLWKKADEREIVFIYPDKLTDVPVRYAALFGPIYGDSLKSEDPVLKDFAMMAREVDQAWRCAPLEERAAMVQVFSLRKMDRARSKVLYSRNGSVAWLMGAVREWQLGCANIPALSLMQPIAPFPLQVERIVNNFWKNNGELAALGRNVLKRMHYYQGIELFLDRLKKDILRTYLSVVLVNSVGLVSSIGNRHNVGLYGLAGQQREASLLLALLGLLLYKCGYKKEAYMEEAAYVMGQILKVSDELHVLYCKGVRGGKTPPRLTGNSVFITALAVPERALAQLGQWMTPYIAWARQYTAAHDRDDAQRIRRYIRLYELFLTKLKGIFTRETRFDDFAKAQVFIGYLAELPLTNEEEVNDMAKRGGTL